MSFKQLSFLHIYRITACSALSYMCIWKWKYGTSIARFISDSWAFWFTGFLARLVRISPFPLGLLSWIRNQTGAQIRFLVLIAMFSFHFRLEHILSCCSLYTIEPISFLGFLFLYCPSVSPAYCHFSAYPYVGIVELNTSYRIVSCP